MDTFINLAAAEARTSGIRADGVRHNDHHELRVDKQLPAGRKRLRRWHCTCGKFVMFAYDAPAKTAYRTHFRAHL